MVVVHRHVVVFVCMQGDALVRMVNATTGVITKIAGTGQGTSGVPLAEPTPCLHCSRSYGHALAMRGKVEDYCSTDHSAARQVNMLPDWCGRQL